MAINKVTYGGKTLVDLTTDTVTPETLASGVTAHDKSGTKITGTRPTDGEILGDNGFISLEVIDVTVGANTVTTGDKAYDYLAGLAGTNKIVAIALLNNPTTNNQLIMAPGSIYGTQMSFKEHRAAYRYRTDSGGIVQGCAIYVDYNMKVVSGTKYRLWVAKTYNITNPKPY